MAPLPANSTGRVRIKYIANGREHVIAPRYAGTGAPTSGFLEGVDDVLINANPFMPNDWTFVEWGYQEAGSSITVPMSGGPTAFAGTRVTKNWDKAAYGDVVGRDLLGRRVKLSLLGWAYGPDEDEASGDGYRLYPDESIVVPPFLAALESSQIVTITANTPIWKQYINIGYNAYFQKKLRTA